MMTGMIQDVTALGQGMEKALGRPFTREKGAIRLFIPGVGAA